MPRSLHEAIGERVDLVEKIQSIEAQLAERAARVASRHTTQTEYAEYLMWKARACRARAASVAQLGRLKVEIADIRKQMALDKMAEYGGVDTMLKSLYSLTKTLISRGAYVDLNEQELIDDVGSYLNSQ